MEKDMFFLAVILIFLGLFLLLYIFLSSSAVKPEKPIMTERSEEPPSYNAEVKEPPSPSPDVISAPKKNQNDVFLNKEQKSAYSTTDAASFREARSEKSWTPAPPPEDSSPEIISFSAEGILFLDYGRQVHLIAGCFEKITPESFLKLKRIGISDIVIRINEFAVHSGSTTLRFSQNQLEQILFLDGGIALVPLDRDEPVVVFLTESVDEIRNYIKKYKREPSRL